MKAMKRPPHKLPAIDCMSDSDLAIFREQAVIAKLRGCKAERFVLYGWHITMRVAGLAYLFALDTSIARQLRKDGDIHGAMLHERNAECTYAKITSNLRW